MTADNSPEEVDGTQLIRQSLRQRALAAYQQKLAQMPFDDLQITPEDVLQTIHELRVHQIELEMQNDELQQSQVALEQSQARFRDLYENAPVGYCLVDADGLISHTNCTLAEMLGLSTPQINRQPFQSFIDKVDQDVFYHLRRRINSSSKTQSCELRILSGQNPLWVQLTVSKAAVEPDSNCLRVALVNIDERVRAEKAKLFLENQLRQSQKMEAVGTLAGGIAHDFNNILTVILVNAELASRLTKQSTPDAESFVREIHKAAGRARDLVNQILAFCRNQPTDRHAIDLSHVIQECIGLLRSTVPARIELKFTSDPGVPKVLADGTQIEQVLINLANNAMQAMNGGSGQLRIHLDTIQRALHFVEERVESDFDWQNETWRNLTQVVRITFADNGPGMEPAIVERIFEPFFTTKPVNEGTGLGLSVVHGIVRSHDGEIAVKSQLGIGTTFTIYLPPAPIPYEDNGVTACDETVLLGSAGTTDSQASTNGSILYVDDDEWVLNSVIQLLAQHGIRVRGCASAAAALNVLRDPANHFEILVTDYNMPGLSGLEFTQQVQKTRPLLPVVIASGYIDNELRSHASEAGVMALLPKPFSAKCFLDLLQQVRKT